MEYFGPHYDRKMLHPTDGTHSNGPSLTLKGQMQQRVDELHITLAIHGPNDPPMSGTVAQQARGTVVKAALFELATTYPLQFRDAVAAGDTADGLAWYFWNFAIKLYKAYGRAHLITE